MNKRARSSIKGEEVIALMRNNESIVQLLKYICCAARTIIKGCANEEKAEFDQKKIITTASSARNGEGKRKWDTISPLLNCIGNIIKQIDKCSIRQARDFLAKALEASVR